MDNNSNNNQKNKSGKPFKQVLALTGIAIQMGITIYVFVLLGKWLDTKYSEGGKGFLIICTLSGVAISLYAVLKQINKLNP